MLSTSVNNCIDRRNNKEWCQLSATCHGWGCRLLTLVPEQLPCSMQERADLFARVYLEAKRLGILSCPYFDETRLDAAVEDDVLLTKMAVEHNLKNGSTRNIPAD